MTMAGAVHPEPSARFGEPRQLSAAASTPLARTGRCLSSPWWAFSRVVQGVDMGEWDRSTWQGEPDSAVTYRVPTA